MEKTRYIYTKDKNCKGCNKCIFVCPTRANEAFFEAEEGKVFIKEGFCISCGECIAICDHDARDYYDDLQRFFSDLKRGEDISIIIAPAARFNFPSTPKLISYLKHIGVNKVYDVSFGADICTWAHVKTMRDHKAAGMIAQPCPVVVSFIEKYHPELIEHLSPIQSPATCTAIYLRDYVGVKDKVAFLSPCIGKMREVQDAHTYDSMEYNVTFSKLARYLEETGVDLNSFPDGQFDNTPGSIGFVFSRPGGLSENIRHHLGERAWIKQVEGIKNIEQYFKEYIKDMKQGNPIPDIVDVLNCTHGCNLGTGTTKEASQNHIDYVTNLSKNSVEYTSTAELMQFFDERLDLGDFIRLYSDKSADYIARDDLDIEQAFLSLGKVTESDRSVNCFSCGYGSCIEFAHELAGGHNDKNNCRHYLLNKFKKLSLLDDLTGMGSRYAYNQRTLELSENHPDFVGVIFIDINGLKEANDTFGHKYGDKLILECCAIVRKVFPEDVFRIGGDEFFVFDERSTEQEFSEKCAKLSKLFEGQQSVFVSMGVAHSYSAEDLSDKIMLADQEMYKNKQEYYRTKKSDRRSR